MSIHSTLVELAKEEGKLSALDVAQSIQRELETVLDCGNVEERRAAMVLLRRVNTSIGELIVGEID